MRYKVPTELQRVKGCLLGLAVGDALGTTLEFTERGNQPIITDMVGGGPFELAPGQWTDDTSMALCIAESLLSNGGFDAKDVMDRFVRWRRHGENSVTGECFGIGITTQKALARYTDTHNPLSGPTEADTAGNGSLMRLAPIPIFYRSSTDRAREFSRLQSLTTHGALEAIEACEFFSDLLLDAFGGNTKSQVLRRREWSGCESIRKIAARDWESKQCDEIVSSGYVVRSLEAVLWCVDRAGSFEDAVVLAVNLGDDADTVGAITGQLAGAILGIEAIPDRWLAQVAWREKIEHIAEELYMSQRDGS